MERVWSGVLETRCHHNLGTNNTSPGLRMIRVADALEVWGYFSLKLLGDMLGFMELKWLKYKRKIVTEYLLICLFIIS